MKNLNGRRKFVALALAGVMALSFTGCDAVVYNDSIEEVYDVIDSRGENVSFYHKF